MFCEEGMIIIEARSAISTPQNTKQLASMKTESNLRRLTNIAQTEG
jgi:hypothetical protein